MIINIELTEPQYDMFKMLGIKIPFPLFVGGYGCGKSQILVINAIRDVMEFRGCKVACYAPTLDLLSLNLIPRIEEKLDELGIGYYLEKKRNILHIAGNRQIYFRSMDNPSRIVAYEVYRSHVDEADLMVSLKKSNEAWSRIIARNRQIRTNRKGKVHKKHFNQVSAYSTPEGFNFTYIRWSKKPGEGYKYINAPTSSNFYLDKDFIKNLEDSYTPEQCKAYLLGLWTNIFSGTVYSYFDKRKHHSNRIIKPKEPLYFGADFNFGGCCNLVYVPHKDGLIAVDELISHDTPQMIEKIKDDYSGHPIFIFPDASGKSESSNASMSDIAMLKNSGFQIKANNSNPRIKDRINSVQNLLYTGRFGINTEKCPVTTEAMQTHSYSETTGLPEKFSGPGTIDDRNDAMGYPPAFLHPIKRIQAYSTDLPF